MFTGIILHKGTVESLEPMEGGRRLIVRNAEIAEAAEQGESIAIDGCCLTVVETSGERIFFELSRETLERTIAGDYAEGTTVNMERSLSLSDRLGGHFVTGHIDGVGRVEAISKEGEFCEMDFRVDLVSPGLVAEKGSVAVNGVSLTVARWNRIGSGGVFRVALIPETLDRTNLGTAPVGTRVNIEYDLIARYVVEALTARSEEERGQ